MAGRAFTQAAIDLIKQFEGYSDKAYMDSAGIWTIGYGTIRINGKPVTPGMTCTREEAEMWLGDKMVLFATDINRLVTRPLTQNQFDALVCFVYNVGTPNFGTSTLLKHLNSGQTIAPERFTDWNKITVIKNGKRIKKALPGLTRRRKAEYQLFMTPDAVTPHV
jgi:lysozyme